jgi:hypothetical protein
MYVSIITLHDVNGIEDFSKKDLVIVWGGTKDVSRNGRIKD